MASALDITTLIINSPVLAFSDDEDDLTKDDDTDLDGDDDSEEDLDGFEVEGDDDDDADSVEKDS